MTTWQPATNLPPHEPNTVGDFLEVITNDGEFLTAYYCDDGDGNGYFSGVTVRAEKNGLWSVVDEFYEVFGVAYWRLLGDSPL